MRLDWIDRRLERLEAENLLRRRRERTGRQGVIARVDGEELLNFASNDYLDLAGDPRLSEAVATALDEEGWGSGASPLIVGHGESHRRLEEALARFEGTEAALVFPSGFAANSGALASVVGPGDVVFPDRKNHASLFDGCRLSRADVRPYAHVDMDHLAGLLERGQKRRRRLIVTDTLFSMDGDIAPLVELAELAERFDAMLMVDEAHATGVFGPNGRGLAEAAGVERTVDVRVGTLSKAVGSIGGFVAGDRRLIDWLLHAARPYIYSTALPGPAAAASLRGIELIHAEPARRETLLARAATFRETLRAAGWTLGPSASQIIPIILGPADAAVDLSTRLRRHGLLVPAIRPPTVPKGEACLRISLTHGHTAEMLERLRVGLGSP